MPYSNHLHRAAADSGSTIWSSAAFYGNPGDNFANIKLIAAFFDKYPEYKSKIVLVVKGGADYADLHPRGTEWFISLISKKQSLIRCL